MKQEQYRSEVLYRAIDCLVDDSEVFPICVPSYNRPNALLLRYAEALPIVLFIRREQEELYSGYKGKCRIVLLNDVYDIGTTRKAIVDWAWNNGYDNIFMMDDDITHTNFVMPGKSSVSDKEFMKMYSTLNQIPECVELWFFKMWVWMIKRCSEKLTLSGPGAKSDAWHIDNKNSKAVYCSGSIVGCIHLNVKNLKENNINYESNSIDGAEDYALQYKIMAEGLYTTIFKDLVFRVPGVGSNTGGNNSTEKAQIEQRYQKYIRLFMENVLDKENADKVGLKTSKGGIPSIKFNWSRWRIKDEAMMYTAEDVLREYTLKTSEK